jgi:hypothetical protein
MGASVTALEGTVIIGVDSLPSYHRVFNPAAPLIDDMCDDITLEKPLDF